MRTILVTRAAVATGILAMLAACGSSTSKTTPPNGTDAGGQKDSGRGDSGKKEDAGKGGTKDSGVNEKETGSEAGSAGCAGYAKAYCDYVAGCIPGTFKADFGGDSSTCVNLATSICERYSPISGSGVNAAWAAACTPALATKASACAKSFVLPLPTPSDPCIVKGALPAGAACGADAQCATSLCDHVGVACGQCAAEGAAGANCGPGTRVTCSPGLACSRTNSKCATLVEEGKSCTPGTTECVGGTDCVMEAGDAGAVDGGTDGGTSGTCRAQGTTVGAMCDPKGIGLPSCYLDAGFVCDESTSKCVAITYAAATDSCGVADGGTGRTDCLGGACIGGSCVALSATGTCTVGMGGCENGSVCIADKGSAAGTCAPADLKCGGKDAGLPAFTFSPSNVGVDTILEWASMAQDETVTTAGDSALLVSTASTAATAQSGFMSPIEAVTQPDGSIVNLVVVKSLTVASTGSIVVSGSVPLVIVSLSDVTFMGGNLQANSTESGTLPGPGGAAGNGGTAAKGVGKGGGSLGNIAGTVGSGGGAFCGVGGAGGGGGTTTAGYGNEAIRPLIGGSSGGGDYGGAGGGAIQIVAARSLNLQALSYITVGGAAAGADSCITPAGGGGSGGAILLEAPTVTIAGVLAANGGSGGGDSQGLDGWDGTNSPETPASGATGTGGLGAGGKGGAGTTPNGTVGGASGAACGIAGGGGGSAGRIRINSATGTATLTSPDMNISPELTTKCARQGLLRSVDDGP